MTQSKNPLITTGLNGLVGSKLAKDFADQYDFINLDIRHPQTPVDITDFKQVLNVFTKSEAKFVIHLAAFTNVSAAWEQRGDKNALAYQVNVNGTANIVQACAETNKHLIHISTAYVFDGEKTEPYLESDTPHAIEWYGQTKLQAEELIQNSSIDWTILRIDQPFRSDEFERADVAHKIIHGLQTDQLYPQFTDHYFGPTFINNFIKILDFIIRTHTTGLYHASSGEQWTDYDFAKLIQQKLNLPGEVKKSSLATYLQTLNRPYQKNTALNCQKLKNILDFKLLNIESAVKTIEL